MATIEILNLADGLTVDISNWKVADKTDYRVVDTTAEPGKREATYQKISGDDEFPLSLRIGHYVNAKSNDGVGQTNISAKLSTYVQKSDVDDVLYTLPCSATLAWTVPGLSGVPDGSDLVELLQNLISFVLPTIAGATSQLALDELKFGVVGGLAAHADTSS